MSIYELGSSTISTEPYINEDDPIDYMINNEDRIRKDSNNIAVDYITRSPNVGYDAYYYYVKADGSYSGFAQPSESYGVVIELNI